MVGLSDRFVLLGTTEHPHEKEALDFVRDHLPNSDPFHARGLVDLLVPGRGALYEIDLLVIGYSAIYLVEIKSHPGRMEGDEQGWIWTPPDDDRPRYLDNPLRLANHKCKVLHDLLERRLTRVGVQTPWVQPLVFLSASKLEDKLSPMGRMAVVTRDTLIRALQFSQFPGADERRFRTKIDRPTMRAIKKAFDELGLKPRKGLLRVGDYVLGPVVEEGTGYQDRTATHAHFEHMQHRARVYLVPEQTSVEERQRLKRAAEREVQLLWSVREQENILTSTYYAADAPLGPTLVFEDFAEALRLDRYVQRHPDLAFETRVEIVRQVGHALHHCHRRNVVHGSLSPQAVLVRERDGKIETRLFNFQLGRSEEASATVHRSALDAQPAGVYQAPELAADPRAMTSASDTFSLGALAYFLFTGQAPAQSTTDLLVRLQRDRWLDPASVADDLPDVVVDAVIEATRLAVDERIDDAKYWVELLVSELQARAPTQPESTKPVLEADQGDILLERFTVKALLGHGASARVLHVEDDDRREYALKVARSEEHDGRVRREGEQIERLRHPRIVQCHEILEIDGRVCLLLSLAGNYTLQNRIAAEGSLDLDLAGRYGEDLLEALKALEDEGILHRDLKPANLGVGTRKKLEKHLTLFDFSLAAAPLEDLEVGTAPYRDPFLPLRGRWDAHADRWSAAVILHEMLTGVRPRHGRPGTSPLDPEATLVVAAERFDAAVRDRLTAFFTQALARAPEERFESGAAMARAWAACLSAQTADSRRVERAGEPAHESDDAAERRGTGVALGTVTDAEIAEIQPTTQIRALPLSSRALNALDRAGLTQAGELLALPNNRLSAIRGIGSKVAREILDLRDRWQAQLGEVQPPAAAAFVPDFTGPELYLERIGLESAVASTLQDAGLPTSTALARAASGQVEAVLRRSGCDPGRVRTTLLGLGAATAAPTVSTTVEGWLTAVLETAAPDRGADADALRQHLGLSPEPISEGAAAERKRASQRRQQVWAQAIVRWRHAPWADALRELCIGIVESMGGVATLTEVTASLRARLGHDTDRAPDEIARELAAIVRVATELGGDDAERRLQLRKTPRDAIDAQTGAAVETATSWALCADEDLWLSVQRLGELADDLARRPVIAASGETERMLAEAVGDSSLAADKIGKQRLVQLAAAASRRAAASSRLEIYPVGMEAERALDLSAQALTGAMSEEVLRTRVMARYPEAAPLPSRAEGLDRLLQPLKLQWDEARGGYVRPDESIATSLHSTGPSFVREPTAMPGQPSSRSEASLRARDFDDSLRAVVQERKLRVWGVNPHRLSHALRALEDALGVQAVALDRRIIARMESLLASKGGNRAVLERTDVDGPEGPNWAKLVAVAEQAAEALADELFPTKEPLLLTQAGLVARYRLKRFVERMVAASQDDRSAAIVLVNATPVGNRADVLNGSMPITGLLPGQFGEVPREWIENRHRAATNHPAGGAA